MLDLNYFEINELACQCRRDWNINEYDNINIFQVAQNKIKNLTIVFTNLGENIFGASNKSKENIIFINSNHTLGKQRLTLAHEIYHLKYDKVKYNICSNLDTEENERNANNFASSLLMPHSALLNFKKENNILKWNLNYIIQLEQFFQINHQEVLERLYNLEEINSKELQEFKKCTINNISLNGYNTNLYKPLTSEKYFTIGNYLKLTEELFTNKIISNGKKEELLSDAYRQDLIYNTKNGKNKIM